MHADKRSLPPRSALPELVIPALGLAFAGYFLVSVDDLAWEAKANSVAVGAVLIALIAVQLVRTFRAVRRGTARLDLDLPDGLPILQLQRILLVAGTAAFLALLPWLGVTLALALLLGFAMWLLGVRYWPGFLGVALGVPAVVYVAFIAFLGTRLPHGPIEWLLQTLLGIGGAG